MMAFYVAQSDLKHLGSSNLSTSAFLSSVAIDSPRFIPLFMEMLVYIKYGSLNVYICYIYLPITPFLVI
jgi:hypothetical protein